MNELTRNTVFYDCEKNKKVSVTVLSKFMNLNCYRVCRGNSGLELVSSNDRVPQIAKAIITPIL